MFIGIDPGKVSFAIIVLDNGGKCIHAEMLKETITSMAKENAHLRTIFREKMKLLFKRHTKTSKINSVLIETFTVRGFGSNMAELIGVMIGNMQAIAEDLGIKENVVMASTWKQKLTKLGYLLKKEKGSFYDKMKLKYYVPDHIVDALLIATYLSLGESFDKFSIKSFEDNVKRAVKFLREEDLLKPKRKVKNAVSTKSRKSK